MTRLANVLPALLLVLSAAACEVEEAILGPEDVAFASELGVDLDEMTLLPSGVYIQTLQPGTGSRTVVASDSVEVAFRLWIPNGTQIEQAQVPAAVTGFAVPGLQDGLLGMVVGEVRLMVLPPEQGFGANPPGGTGIPPHSVLVFEVGLLEIFTIE